MLAGLREFNSGRMSLSLPCSNSIVEGETELLSLFCSEYFSAFLLTLGPAFLNRMIINKFAGTTIRADVKPIFTCRQFIQRGPIFTASGSGTSPKDLNKMKRNALQY